MDYRAMDRGLWRTSASGLVCAGASSPRERTSDADVPSAEDEAVRSGPDEGWVPRALRQLEGLRDRDGAPGRFLSLPSGTEADERCADRAQIEPGSPRLSELALGVAASR